MDTLGAKPQRTIVAVAAAFKDAAPGPAHQQGSIPILWVVLVALAFTGVAFGAAKELGLIRTRL